MTIQRESIKIKYGKTLNMGDYNSVVMHIEETYLVPDTVDFDAKAFTLMKATEFEQTIDEKLQPKEEVYISKMETKTIKEKYPQTAKTPVRKGICEDCLTDTGTTWQTQCKKCYAIAKKRERQNEQRDTH